MYQQTFQVTWADIDANQHMRNTAYLDYAAQTRFMHLAGAGFTPEAFAKARIGPAILEETIRYRREMKFLDRFTVQHLAAGTSADRSKNVIVNRVLNEAGELCCEIRATFVWLDLAARKITPPPEALRAAMESLERTEDFAEL